MHLGQDSWADRMSLFHTALPEEASGQEGSPSKVALPHGRQVGAGCWLGPQPGPLAKASLLSRGVLPSAFSQHGRQIAE